MDRRIVPGNRQRLLKYLLRVVEAILGDVMFRQPHPVLDVARFLSRRLFQALPRRQRNGTRRSLLTGSVRGRRGRRTGSSARDTR